MMMNTEVTTKTILTNGALHRRAMERTIPYDNNVYDIVKCILTTSFYMIRKGLQEVRMQGRVAYFFSLQQCNIATE